MNLHQRMISLGILLLFNNSCFTMEVNFFDAKQEYEEKPAEISSRCYKAVGCNGVCYELANLHPELDLTFEHGCIQIKGQTICMVDEQHRIVCPVKFQNSVVELCSVYKANQFISCVIKHVDEKLRQDHTRWSVLYLNRFQGLGYQLSKYLREQLGFDPEKCIIAHPVFNNVMQEVYNPVIYK